MEVLTEMGKPIARVIHVKHLFFYLLKKWYVVLIGMLIGILGFSLMGVVNIKEAQKAAETKPKEKETKISVSEAEFYNVLAVVEYEDMLEQKNRYISNSIRMRIDPFHRWDCNDICTVMTEGEQTLGVTSNEVVAACVEFLSSQEFFEELSSRTGNNLEAGFLKEVIAVAAVSGETFHVSVCHYDKEELRNLCDTIDQILLEQMGTWEQFRGYRIDVKKGNPSETVDNGLLEVQNATRSEAIATQDVVAYRLSLLSENALEYLALYRDARYTPDYEAGQTLMKTTTVNNEMPALSLSALKGDMVKGAVVGVVLAVLILSCVYIFHPFLLNPDNLNDMLGLRILNDRKGIPAMAGETAVIAFKVEQSMPEGNREVFITGSVLTEETEEIVQQLKRSLQSSGINACVVGFLKEQPEQMEKLKGAEQIILVERLGKSRWDNLTWQISLFEETGKCINGVLLI